MTPERLLALFERISEAPDAIHRLRQYILELAVRGRLVEQNPADTPVSDTLTQLVKQHSGKATVRGSALTPTSLPFEIPKHWVWIALNALGVLSGGMTPSKNRSEYWNGDVNWFSPKDIKSDELVESELKITRLGVAETGLQVYPVGCLFMVARSGILKRTFPVAINSVPATANQDLKILRPFVDGMQRYLLIMFHGMTRFILSALVKTGTTVQSLKYDEFETQPIPFPPLAEQHRIVAKVDELMVLCDRLEAAQADREARRDRLATASLHHLNNGANTEAFRERAHFYINQLPRLTTRPEQIKQVREAVLNLAIRGNLVAQAPHEEPASELLRRIGTTRTRLYADRQIPKPQALPEIASDALPFEIRQGWQWTILGALCYQVSDGPHYSPTYVDRENGVRFLSTRNVRIDRFDLTDVKYVSRADHERFCERIRPQKGDILYTKGGTTGIARVNDLEFEFSVWVHLAVLRVAKECLDPYYVALALNSPFCYEQSQAYTQGISNFDLGLTRMTKILLPLPPRGEQSRIVARVNELMGICDQLETQLTTAQTERRRLLGAVLQEALTSASSQTA